MIDSASRPPPLASLRLSVGQWVAERYETLGLIGRGGMGEVYLARDREVDRNIALKVLPDALQRRDARAVDRFLRQARLAARVAHPAIVQIFDCGVDGGLPFVAQELLSGRTVADLLAHERNLDPNSAVELVRDLCQALIAAHDADVIHRDVKPSNLFLHRAGGARPQLKLLDFGLARLLRSADALTRTNEVFGTLSYMAPEQLLGARSARIEADVYAVGCVLFELLTGRPPFVRGTRAELKLALLHDPPPDPREFVSGVPVQLSEVCRRALAKRPEDRLRNLTEMLAALDGCQPLTRERALGDKPPESARFKLERVIGRGSHGEVHAAIDLQLGQRIAVKSVKTSDVEGVHRLKREFRALRRLRHPNIVRAHTLFEERSQLRLELEFIDGVRFDEYVQGSPEKLRAATVQLCDALAALHGSGLAHRDLKPANVLVERSGRVVLVDFGLTMPEEENGGLEGSTKYLPPEAQQQKRGPAADLYALGVMLREALTGCLSELPDLATAPDYTALEACSVRLSERAPELRPSAREVLTWLSRGAHTQPSTTARLPFVGRRAELATLQAAFQASTSGRPCLVELYGENGIGKSALLRAFLAGVRARALVLEGRCRQDERLAFAALDLPLDQLSVHLRKLPRVVQRTLLPRELGALTRVFPAFLRVDLARERATQEAIDSEATALEAQAFDQLRQLLCAVCARQPVVLALEDLPWTDPQALELLSHLLAEPTAPALLVVFTRRPQPIVPALDALLHRSPSISLPLDRLSTEDAASWLKAIAYSAYAAAQGAEQTAGHPYLLSLLARAAHENGEGATVEGAISELVQRQTAGARRLLQAVCISERPLPYDVLFNAADAGHAELLELEDATLVSRCAVGETWSFEVYHPSIRELVLADLEPEERARLHRRFVSLLSETTRPESLIEHLAQAGEPTRALELSLCLARKAEEQHLFARAATLYEIVAEHVPVEVTVRGRAPGAVRTRAPRERPQPRGRAHTIEAARARGAACPAAARAEGERALAVERRGDRRSQSDGALARAAWPNPVDRPARHLAGCGGGLLGAQGARLGAGRARLGRRTARIAGDRRAHAVGRDDVKSRRLCGAYRSAFVRRMPRSTWGIPGSRCAPARCWCGARSAISRTT